MSQPINHIHLIVRRGDGVEIDIGDVVNLKNLSFLEIAELIQRVDKGIFQLGHYDHLTFSWIPSKDFMNRK